MRSLCSSLTSPATLEHLEFNTLFCGSFNSDSDGYYEVSTFYDDLRDADVWSLLDSFTSHPTGSQLERVEINMGCCFASGSDDDDDDYVDDPDEDRVLNAVLDSLPLLRTKGILFVEANGVVAD